MKKRNDQWTRDTASCRALMASVAGATLSLSFAGMANGEDSFRWSGSGSSAAWSDTANWYTFPSGYGTIQFDDGNSAGRTDSSYDLSNAQNKLIWYDNRSWTLNQGGSTALSLYDNGGTQAKIEDRSTGTVTINLPLTFAATSGANWGEINAINGDFTFGTGTLTVNGSGVNGIRLFGSNHTTTFNNTVSASGKYFDFTGNSTTVAIGNSFTAANVYVMNGGVLSLTSDASLGTTAVRLGGDDGMATDGGGNAFQNLGAGATLRLTTLTGGTNVTSAITPQFGNSSGALKIDSQNTSNANTLSGPVDLQNNLTVTQAGGGTVQFTGVISNGGGLTLDGAGTVMLAGKNTYTGDTQITAGTLQLAASDAAAGPSKIVLGAASGTADAELDLTATNVTFASIINPRGGGTLTIASKTNRGTNALSGHIGADHDFTIAQTSGGTLNLTAARADATGTTTGYDIKGNTLTLNAAASSGNLNAAAINVSGTIYNSVNSGNVTVTGGGGVTFSGANTYAGYTTIDSGASLTLTGTDANGAAAGTLGTGEVRDNGVLNVNNPSALTQVISGTGGVTLYSAGGAKLSGVNTYKGGTTIEYGTLTVTGNGTLGDGAGAVAFSGSNYHTLEFAAASGTHAFANAILDPTVNGTTSGSVSQTGAGKTVLTGDNTYANLTDISAGTLVADSTTVHGATGPSPVRIDKTGVLAGNGKALGTIDVGYVVYRAGVPSYGGTITAGDGAEATDKPGTLTTGAQTWEPQGTDVVKFKNSAGPSGTATGFDRLSMTTLNLLQLGGGNTFNLKLLKTTAGTTTGTFDAAAAKAFVIAYAGDVTLPSGYARPTGTSVTDVSGLFTLDTSGVTFANDARFTVGLSADGGGYDLNVGYSAAPEPGVAALAGLGGLGVLGRRRRHNATGTTLA